MLLTSGPGSRGDRQRGQTNSGSKKVNNQQLRGFCLFLWSMMLIAPVVPTFLLLYVLGDVVPMWLWASYIAYAVFAAFECLTKAMVFRCLFAECVTAQGDE